MPGESEMTERLEPNDHAETATEPRLQIVGIGTSTTHLDALLRLLAQMQIDTGLAFVVVLHGESAHDPIRVESWNDHTPLTVLRAASGMLVEPNHVYVISPDQHIVLQRGVLHSAKPSMPLGMRLPVDYLFRSLAEELGDRAIGIVLFGTEGDGVLGLEAIKEHGGLTFCETRMLDPHDEMAVGSMQARIVDVVATPEEIATRLNAHMKPASLTLEQDAYRRVLHGDALPKILARLRQHSGHDFDGYKESTIVRRILRRMTLGHLEQVDDYVRLLYSEPAEVEALFREVLIGVTSFFRDPDAFASLERWVIQPMFKAHRDSSTPIRVWIPGCSTGEEAYSVAMLLHEHASRNDKPPNFQIFATDIDPIALERGRRGRYPASIAADVDPERFKTFFVREKNGPTVIVEHQLRSSLIFAVQSVFKDPPFGKLDLICCRNLMIYFESELQQRVLPIFHYALKRGGYLFLGNSESLKNSQRLFRTLDQKWKIFQRQEVSPEVKSGVALRHPHFGKEITAPPKTTRMNERPPSLREMTEQLLLADYTPTSIVVNDVGDMLYVHGRTGKFLEQTTGEVTTNLLKVAREGLRIPLMTALHNVKMQQKPYECDVTAISHDQGAMRVRLTAAPMAKSAPTPGLIFVTLTEISPPRRQVHQDEVVEQPAEHSARVDELETELNSTREHLHATIEQLEHTNEDLKSAIDELQTSNEELQRTNEELQTSKEELQSVNEELITLNAELQLKIDELTSANNDIKHLLDNARVGMIFLDAKLRVRRFTNAATDVVDLINADIGRPLAQFVHRLCHDRLIEDARRVLETRQPHEKEHRAADGHWYLVRILPYRTIENTVEGVVLTFTDVTQLNESKEKLEFLFDVLPVGVSVLDRKRQAFKYNAAFLRMSDLTSEEFRQGKHNNRTYYRPDASEREGDEFAVSRILAGEASALNVESGFIRRNGKMTWLDTSAVSCPFADWSVIVVTSDVTARKEAEIALHASEEKFSKAFHLAPLMIGIIDLETRTLVECNQRFLDVSGYTRDEAIGASTLKLGWVSAETAARLLAMMGDLGYVRNEEIVCRAKDGREFDCLYHGFIMDVGGKKQIVSMIQDISERKRSEEAIKTKLRQEKETVLRELAHRTKNNMFVIRSMLNLHAMHTQNEEVQRLFADVENKIVAMALVHQKLYQSKNLSRLDLGEYLQELAPALASSQSLTPQRIAVHIDAEGISALIDTAIPCGLVVTELVTNAFKHAFPNERPGNIFIRLRRKPPNTIQLEVCDDGVGIAPNFDVRGQPTLGLQTIFMIVEHQLKGTVTFHSTPPGLACHIEFAETLYSERV